MQSKPASRKAVRQNHLTSAAPVTLLLLPQVVEEFARPIIRKLSAIRKKQKFAVWREISFEYCSRKIVAVTSPRLFGALGAAEVTDALLEKYHPELVVLLGFAATLHNDLKLGDVAVKEAMIQIAAENQSLPELVNLRLTKKLSRILVANGDTSCLDSSVAFVGYSSWRREEIGDANLLDEQVFVVRDGQVRFLNARHDLEKFSPDGLSWGYRGSGSAQLAIAILMEDGQP